MKKVLLAFACLVVLGSLPAKQASCKKEKDEPKPKTS